MKHCSVKKFYRLSLLSALFLAGTALSFFPVPAKAQDMDSRIRRLENEIQTISRAVFRGEAMPPPADFSAGQNAASQSAVDLALRLQQVEMDLRSLTGKIEKQEFENRQLQERIEKSLKMLEDRLSTLEEKSMDISSAPVSEDVPQPQKQAGALTGSDILRETQPPQPNGLHTQTDLPRSGVLGTLSTSQEEGASSSTGNDPAGSYEHAFALLRNRDYDGAEKAFKEFLDRYGDHDLAANAQYWLGETFYVRGDFKNAARIFAEAYQKYAKGPKGPDNLLKLGMSLAGMGKNDDACLSYAQLVKEYPSGAQSVLTRVKQEMEKLGCAGR